MAIQIRRYTAKEFEEFINLPENANKLFEFIGGEVIEMPAPSPRHAYIADEIYSAIRKHVKKHDLGFAFSDSVSYTLSGEDVLIPDASFVSKERQATLPDQFTIAPDIAVEVISPSNRPREMLSKVERYLEHGARLVWVVYPDEQVVDVYRRAEDGSLNLRKIEADGRLTGGDVLPDFQLALKDLFSI